jgi:hydrogenase maturation protein HypF
LSEARLIRVRGVVQGVGFRPFVYRLAHAHGLAGWVLNGEQGVEIFLEGADQKLEAFVRGLSAEAPPAASISEVQVQAAEPAGFEQFVIRESERKNRPSVRVSPDLPVCSDCLRELFDPANRRFQYPYINCTNCGPRYTVVLGLPYDRSNTTMKAWPLDEACRTQYEDPANRRFHAQPVACPACGPKYYLLNGNDRTDGTAATERAAKLLCEGKIVAVKGLGGYHLACDARNKSAVLALRERKFRKEKPFAVMVPDLAGARDLIELNQQSEALLTDIVRPIVLAPAKVHLSEVAPGTDELGVMLPYTPLHHLLFAAGAPDVLVMTSANRSSEPIAYVDADALESLAGIADAFLVGERPIARRVDDSVARIGAFGPAILRRARGYAPAAVAMLPTAQPLLALGADLKNSITLVVNGQAFVSQYIGDLDHYASYHAFEKTVRDLCAMYEVHIEEVTLAHDAHPQYRSTTLAAKLPAGRKIAVQHHRAHIASVIAERGGWNARVVGVSCDGTGYGDDGSIWGGEFFVGSVAEGFERAAHLRPALLPGGDAAAEFPVQAAAGLLTQLAELPDLTQAPFFFPARYAGAAELVCKNVRCFPTTSMGRLFDSAAALLGFTREITYEGQAAIWLEQLAKHGALHRRYPLPFAENELDFRPLLRSVIDDRLRGEPTKNIARCFQLAIAEGLTSAVKHLCKAHSTNIVVLSGGVFQNELLLSDLKTMLAGLEVWTNHAVPANDAGISLGQAALAAFSGAS